MCVVLLLAILACTVMSAVAQEATIEAQIEIMMKKASARAQDRGKSMFREFETESSGRVRDVSVAVTAV